jgi:hypothetical protein
MRILNTAHADHILSGSDGAHLLAYEDDSQMVPQQQMADHPMAVDVAYHFPTSVVTGSDAFLSKPIGAIAQPSTSLSASTHAPAASAVPSPEGSTGFESLDDLGLLDGLISPRGLNTPSAIDAPQFAFGAEFKQGGRGGQQVAGFLVPETVQSSVFSCSSTPSQSPTYETPHVRQPPLTSASLSPVPQSSPPMTPPSETSMVMATTVQNDDDFDGDDDDDGEGDVASPGFSEMSAATRKSRRQSANNGVYHRASTAASARKSASAPVVPAPKTRAPRGPTKAAQGKSTKATAPTTIKKGTKTNRRSKALSGKRVKKEVSTAAAAAVMTASLAQLDRSGALPADHKPARGRGRQLQLAKMTPAQRAAEAKARLEKNRQAARGFRARRKDHIMELEDQVSDFEVREAQQQAVISSLQGEIEALKRLLQQQNNTRK